MMAKKLTFFLQTVSCSTFTDFFGKVLLLDVYCSKSIQGSSRKVINTYLPSEFQTISSQFWKVLHSVVMHGADRPPCCSHHVGYVVLHVLTCCISIVSV